MTKYNNKIADLKAANKRALLSLRSKTMVHQLGNVPAIIEDKSSKYTSPKFKNREAALLKNQLNDCRDTLLVWQKLNKIKNVGSDAQKSLLILDNFLQQVIDEDVMKEASISNHRIGAFGGKIKASIRAIINHDFISGNNNESGWQHAQSYIESVFNVDFSHIKKIEKQHQYNSKKHQLIIETVA
ncbi:MAG: hypothetical protein K0U39_03035 [Alphaproteobacteria bacterium]|nr:hypothetical protein [Alphaproteobacteria bacterium]